MNDIHLLARFALFSPEVADYLNWPDSYWKARVERLISKINPIDPPHYSLEYMRGELTYSQLFSSIQSMVSLVGSPNPRLVPLVLSIIVKEDRHIIRDIVQLDEDNATVYNVVRAVLEKKRDRFIYKILDSHIINHCNLFDSFLAFYLFDNGMYDEREYRKYVLSKKPHKRNVKEIGRVIERRKKIVKRLSEFDSIYLDEEVLSHFQ